MKESVKRYWLPIALVSIVYLVGIVGMNIEPFRPLFLILTPILLCLTAGVMLYYNREWSPKYVVGLLIIMVGGYALEVWGVQGGYLFGDDYRYGDTLGPKILGVPPVMGVNWLILIYAVGSMLKLGMPGQKALRPWVGGLFMVLIDAVIEPVAKELDFWTWQEFAVPALNYVVWFGASVIFLYVNELTLQSRRNRVAAAIFPIQLIFFLALAITL